MQSSSCRNLQALLSDAQAPIHREPRSDQSLQDRSQRCVFVSNQLPLKYTRNEVDGSYEWEMDDNALIANVQDGLEGMEAVYVGCLPTEIDAEHQETVALELMTEFNCYPVFLTPELKQRFYKGFCKQQLWPLFHYLLPLMPDSKGRFNAELWQAYVKANMIFADKLVEVMNVEEDYIWIHDYHLLVLPSLLRKKFNTMRCGLFLHSPFPSSEMFRTFPKRDELLRSMLNADLIGFHTFDYARHFLSCCSRMLGIEHVASRGSIMLDYFGRDVGIKIMPTGVNPNRFLDAFKLDTTKWRIGELVSQFENQTILIGVDDMDLFKGIELKLLALEQLLRRHPEWIGKLVLIQVTNPPRSSGKDVTELNEHVLSIGRRINGRYGSGGYKPLIWLDRPVPLYEKVALYSVSDVAIVTATRDGMNLVPYEYIVCRQGSQMSQSKEYHESSLIISEFVGCSPSMSGAIRVNPWSVDDVSDGIFSAITMASEEKHLRHEKHWRYVSSHTASFWAQSFLQDLKKFTKEHDRLRCWSMGLGLDNFRVVALTENFRKLDPALLQAAYQRSQKRLFLLDYDGTLNANGKIDPRPTEGVLKLLQTLTEDPANTIYIISGRARKSLGPWFSSVKQLGIAAEHGFYVRRPGEEDWVTLREGADDSWREMVGPIMKVYAESTDGSYTEEKESALVWSYSQADPDFGRWQAKELLDHLEGVLGNLPVEVVQGNNIVEVKPQGVSKGAVVDRLLVDLAESGSAPDFVLCIGDDRSDEDMFATVESVTVQTNGTLSSDQRQQGSSSKDARPSRGVVRGHTSRQASSRSMALSSNVKIPQNQVFACTVGQKPSSAPFYVNDIVDVTLLLSRLANLEGATILQGLESA